MTFTAKAWSSVAGLLEAIEVHPFVQGLLPGLRAARARAKEAAGWVMDVYLLRAP